MLEALLSNSQCYLVMKHLLVIFRDFISTECAKLIGSPSLRVALRCRSSKGSITLSGMVQDIEVAFRTLIISFDESIACKER